MTTREAEAVVMLFGKYKGLTLGEIADEDILYLDRLAGEEIRNVRLYEAICTITQARANEIDAKLEDR